jgi:hypothetical protein
MILSPNQNSLVAVTENEHMAWFLGRISNISDCSAVATTAQEDAGMPVW